MVSSVEFAEELSVSILIILMEMARDLMGFLDLENPIRKSIILPKI
jgi:hypothetical protein